jgi:hypothetical protein
MADRARIGRAAERFSPPKRQIAATLVTLAAAVASLGTSEDCSERTLSNEGQTLLTPAIPAAAQRFRVIAPRPSSFRMSLELHSTPGASVRAALVADAPSLFSADGGRMTGSEIVLAQISAEPATGTIELPPCDAPACAEYGVRLDLESTSGVEVDVRWTAEVAFDACDSEGNDEYIELRRE